MSPKASLPRKSSQLASKQLVTGKSSVPLPHEILEIIFRKVRTLDIAWKAGLVRVCRAWYIVAIAHLYETVEPLSMRAMSRLRSTVRQQPSLASHIRTLKFPCLESTIPGELEFNAGKSRIGKWKPAKYEVEWLRTTRLSLVQIGRPAATFYAHCRKKVSLDYRSICLLLECFIEIAANCTQLHTLQLPTIDFKVSEEVYSSFLTTVKYLILVQLHVDSYSAMSNHALANAYNVETLAIIGAFSTESHQKAFIDRSFFPKLHTLNLEQFTSAGLIKEIIKQHGPKLTHVTVWPKSSTLWPAPAPNLGHGDELVQIKRLTIVLNYNYEESFKSILSLPELTSLSYLEIHLYTLRYVTYFMHRLPRTLVDLVITNLSWTGGDLNLTLNEVRASLQWDTATLSRLYPALRSFTILWRTEPHVVQLWNTVASKLRNVYLRVGINFRMEFISGGSQSRRQECANA